MAINHFFSELKSRFGFHRSNNTTITVKKPENQFPQDILRLIFTFLPGASLKQSRAVCTVWRTIISEPQFSNKINILALKTNLAKIMKSPQFYEKEIGDNLIELAKMKAISDPKAALQTIEKLQKFMAANAFFEEKHNKYTKIKILVEIAKIQAKLDPENAVKTVRTIEIYSLTSQSQDESTGDTFMECIHNGKVNNVYEGYYRDIPKMVHFFVKKARLQIAYDLQSAHQTVQKAKIIIDTFDTQGQIPELDECLVPVAEQIARARTEIETISTIKELTFETFEYAVGCA